MTPEQNALLLKARARLRLKQNAEKQTEKPGKPPLEDPYSAKNIAGAATEPGLTMLSGALAYPLSGLAGLGSYVTNALGMTDIDPAKAVSNIQEMFTYQPRTSGAKTVLDAAAVPFRAYGENIIDPAAEKAYELTGSPAVAAITKVIGEAPLALYGGRASGKMGNKPPAGGGKLGAVRRGIDYAADLPEKGIDKVWSGVKNFVDPHMPGGKVRSASRSAHELVGPYREEVNAALANAKPGETVGQAAANTRSYEIAALQRLAEKENPSKWKDIATQQNQARLDSISKKPITDSEIAALQKNVDVNAGRNYGKVRNDLVDPRSNAQKLTAAAILAQQKAAAAEASKIAALRDAGRFKTLEAQSGQVAKGNIPVTGKLREQSIRQGANQPEVPSTSNPPRYPGEVTAPERYAPQKPLQRQAGIAAEEASAIAKQRLVKQQVMNDVEQTMLVNMVGETNPSLTEFLSRPAVSKAIKSAKEITLNKGESWPKVDEQFTVGNLQLIKRAIAEDLQKKIGERKITGAKKDAIRTTLESFNDWIKSKSKGYGEGEAQFIKDSDPLNRAKVTKALYESLLPKVNTGKADAAINTPLSRFLKATEKGNTTAKDALKFDIPMEKVIPEKMGAVENIRNELIRDEILKRKGIEGMKPLKKALETALPKEQIPGFLNTVVFVLRSLNNKLHGRATKGALDEMFNRLDNPAEFRKLLRLANPDEAKVLMEYLKARNRMLVTGAIADQENR